MINGANDEVRRNFEKRFKVNVFEGYGLTETTSFSCINCYPKNKRVIGSIGKELPINDMAIFNPDNFTKMKNGMEGEICIRGYNVAKYYHNLRKQNKKSFFKGWFRSGDYGKVDNNGNFYFAGRKDSMIIKGGENISSIKKSSYNKQRYQLILQDTKNKINTEISNAWSKYQSSKSVLEATKAQLKAAEIANEGITLEYDLSLIHI